MTGRLLSSLTTISYPLKYNTSMIFFSYLQTGKLGPLYNY